MVHDIVGRSDNISTSVEWYTPDYIFGAMNGRFDLDSASPGADIVPWVPADRHYTIKDDGLRQPWTGFCWVNPPYGREILPKWVEKFRLHANGILLVPERTSTAWWQGLTIQADLVLCVSKKIPFINPARPKRTAHAIGSTFIAIGARGVSALHTAHQNGLGILLKPLRRSSPPKVALPLPQ